MPLSVQEMQPSSLPCRRPFVKARILFNLLFR
jgi:hypothetical protein